MTVDEVIKKLSDLPIFILDDDIRMYHKYSSALSEGANILDLGTGWGKSALCLALSNPKALVTTIDTGQWQIEKEWAKDEKDYQVKIVNQFKKYGADNIMFVYGDVRKVSIYNTYDVIHTDIFEAGLLSRWIPYLKKDGVLLVRNYIRHGVRPDTEDALIAEVDGWCKNKSYEYIEHGGLIQVIKKL